MEDNKIFDFENIGFEFDGVYVGKNLTLSQARKSGKFCFVEEGTVVEHDEVWITAFPPITNTFDEEKRRIKVGTEEFYFRLLFMDEKLASIRMMPFIQEFDKEAHYPNESYLLQKFSVCETVLRQNFGEPEKKLSEDKNGNFFRKIVYKRGFATIESFVTYNDRVGADTGNIYIRYQS